MCLLFVLFIGGLTESAALEELRASVVLDAAQTESHVLFHYLDLGNGLSRQYGIYDFKEDRVTLAKDSRLNSISDAIVASDGLFYIEYNEEVHVISPYGEFLEELRLQEFDGWRSGVTVEAVESDGTRAVALCHDLENSENYLATLDFKNKTARFVPIRFPAMNRYIETPDYAVVPFNDEYLRIEVHTAEVVRLDRHSLEEIETLQQAHKTTRKRQRHSGITTELQIFTRPFIVTSSGLSGKFLKTRNHQEKLFEQPVPGGFLIEGKSPASYSPEIVLGTEGEKKLLWNRTHETIFLSSPSWSSGREFLTAPAPND